MLLASRLTSGAAADSASALTSVTGAVLDRAVARGLAGGVAEGEILREEEPERDDPAETGSRMGRTRANSTAAAPCCPPSGV